MVWGIPFAWKKELNCGEATGCLGVIFLNDAGCPVALISHFAVALNEPHGL